MIVAVNSAVFCSSEKINGNKTDKENPRIEVEFCSSEKINGNKTETH